MSDTIIVGVADAAASRPALDWAAQRARDTGAHLVLVAVVGGAVGAVGEADLVARVSASTRESLDAIAAPLRATGVEVTVRVDAGDPIAVLVDASRSAGLLVIGGEPRAHGRRGQHGARIAAGAHCPVVVVPTAGEATDGAERRGVVVGVDGSEVSDAAIEFAAVEAERLGEPLVMVSAWMPIAVPGDFGVYPDLYLTDLAGVTQSAMDRVVDGVRSRHPSVEVTTHVGEGDPALVIVDAARTARLAVVGSHGRGAFARFLLGSVSEEVVAQLVCATAVVR